MAIIGPFTNGFFSVNGVDLSDHARSISIETERAEVDVTAMGASNIVNMPGLGDATITVEVLQDFAAGEVDATIWPLSTTSTPFTVAVRPVNAAISATNPEYQMSSLLYSYSPIAGSIGDAMTTELTFRNAAQAGLVRDVTP
jgi:hypothetical protein